MSWPQWIMVALLIVSVIQNAFEAGRNRSYSSGQATLHIFGYVAYYTLFAGLLHAGGFW